MGPSNKNLLKTWCCFANNGPRLHEKVYSLTLSTITRSIVIHQHHLRRPQRFRFVRIEPETSHLFEIAQKALLPFLYELIHTEVSYLRLFSAINKTWVFFKVRGNWQRVLSLTIFINIEMKLCQCLILIIVPDNQINYLDSRKGFFFCNMSTKATYILGLYSEHPDQGQFTKVCFTYWPY